MRVIWPSGPYYPLHVFISSGCDSVLFEVLPMCKTSTRTKRAPWMEQTLTQALAAVKDGISQRDAADNFKIRFDVNEMTTLPRWKECKQSYSFLLSLKEF